MKPSKREHLSTHMVGGNCDARGQLNTRCQAQSCFAGSITFTAAGAGMAPPEPLVWHQGATQDPTETSY